MHCIERGRQGLALMAAVTVLGGCSVRLPSGPTPPTPPPSPSSPAGPAPAPSTTGAVRPPPPPSPATSPTATPPTAAATSRKPPPRLGPPAAARNWAEFKLQAARRLVSATPDGTYTGAVPEPLLAIPVLEVELNGDGSVRRVQVLREPRQAKDTIQLAIDAVHRSAPYGDMSRLPRPWKWVEVFLFDDDRRFKPRELDQ